MTSKYRAALAATALGRRADWVALSSILVACSVRGPTIRESLTWIAAAFYVFAGASHFLNTAAYLKIMPPGVPWPLAMVFLSGGAEIAGGAGLLIRAVRRVAAFGLIALLVAVFPANIYMAMRNVQVTSTPIPNWLLWLRLPVQFLLIWWLLYIRGGYDRKAI